MSGSSEDAPPLSPQPRPQRSPPRSSSGARTHSPPNTPRLLVRQGSTDRMLDKLLKEEVKKDEVINAHTVAPRMVRQGSREALLEDASPPLVDDHNHAGTALVLARRSMPPSGGGAGVDGGHHHPLERSVDFNVAVSQKNKNRRLSLGGSVGSVPRLSRVEEQKTMVIARRKDDLEGLFGLATLLVVLYHINPSYFPGGFVGIDIFFVLSGYLTSSLVVRDVEDERFRFASFYAKRVRRVFLPLAVVLLFTWLAAFLLYTRWRDEKDIMIGTAASVIGVSNFYLAFVARGPLAINPLAHLWIIALEEQFFAVWPVVVYLFADMTYFRLGITFVTAAAFVASEVGCVLSPAIAYYMMPTRCGPFLLGALIVLYKKQLRVFRADALLATFAALLGAAVAVGSCLVFSDKVAYPGWRSVLPSFGTCLVIAFGSDENMVSNAVALMPFRSLGAIGYCVYLVHWPLLSMLRFLAVSIEGVHAVSVFVYSIAMGFALHVMVEKPTRNSKASNGVTFVAFYVVPALAVMACVVTLVFLQPRAMMLGPSTTERQGDLRRYRDLLASDVLAQPTTSCFLQDGTAPPQHFSDACYIGSGKRRSSSILYGDSQAAAYMGMFEEFANANDSQFFFLGMTGCPPVGAGASQSCQQLRASLPKLFGNFSTVILAARWSILASQGEGIGKRTRQELVSLVQSMSAQGKRVVLVGEAPQIFNVDPNACPDAKGPNMALPCFSNRTIRDWEEDPQCFNRVIRDITLEHTNASYWDSLFYQCVDGVCSLYNSLGVKMYRDSSLLAYRSAKIAGREIVERWGIPNWFRG